LRDKANKRDANQAFSNVQNGVNYAQAAKNALVAANGGGQSSPVPVTTPNKVVPSVTPSTVASVEVTTPTTVESPSPIILPTTLQTVTQGQPAGHTVGIGKGRVSE
jgi:hypothetical protein